MMKSVIKAVVTMNEDEDGLVSFEITGHGGKTLATGADMNIGVACQSIGAAFYEAEPFEAAEGRIDILAWRRHGDDESTVEVALVPAEADEHTARAALAEINDVVFGLDDNAEVPEGKRRAYVIDDFVIRDGDTFTVQNDRTFQVTIREVTR
jgi:hypothetical protein